MTALLDDFSEGIDPEVWTQVNGPGRVGNFEAECYRPSALSASSAGLAIAATWGSSDPAYSFTSGELDTGFVYGSGVFTARLKMPQTPCAGIWPAFWLVSRHAGLGPTQEIDIVEWFGNQPTKLRCTYIWDYSDSTKQTSSTIDVGVDLSAGFHNYSVEWSPASLLWKFDGAVVKTLTGAGAEAIGTVSPSNLMKLILNVAVGSSASLGGATNGSTILPAVMQVARVTVSELGDGRNINIAVTTETDR